MGLEGGEFVMNKLYEFHEKEMQDGRIVGKLQKINDLHNTAKLLSAGLLEISRAAGAESGGR